MNDIILINGCLLVGQGFLLKIKLTGCPALTSCRQLHQERPTRRPAIHPAGMKRYQENHDQVMQKKDVTITY